ncbi:sensory rhodopsin transducer [Bacillus sonorensis]|uniref:sensory rhodopsin transducer n=1 Tax=Bacillus sonorensis TaxID=119858 RepID=UPI0004954111|nr:sensory rhodopsin transducer [Bacillus sonorensis]MEC1588817.1 sensory rhodopsin transducer [Bacillus sonorensis]
MKGEHHWIIPDGFIPPVSSGDLTSHESICVLNCYGRDATLAITVYFEDRPPLEGIAETVKGRRTKHIRTSLLHASGERIPENAPYAIEIESDIPVIVQYSRLDTTQPELALMSTMAYPLKTNKGMSVHE